MFWSQPVQAGRKLLRSIVGLIAHTYAHIRNVASLLIRREQRLHDMRQRTYPLAVRLTAALTRSMFP